MKRTIVLVGLSASGKTTVKDLLVAAGLVRYGVTCTTRAPRPGEVDGRDYDFITPEAFEAGVQYREIPESTRYISNTAARYGISCLRLNEAFYADLPTLWILDTIGLQFMQGWCCENVLSVALVAGREMLRYRMTRRGDTEETITSRMANYDQERDMALLACDHTIDTTRITPEHVAWNVLTLMGV